MVAANVPEELKDYWTSLFFLSGMDLYNARTVDLEELLEHMEIELDFYDSGMFAKATIEFLRKLKTDHDNGILFALSETDDLIECETHLRKPFELLDVSEISSSPYTNSLATSRSSGGTLELRTLSAIAAITPPEKPEKRNFPTLASYLQALARWKIKQKEEAREV